MQEFWAEHRHECSSKLLTEGAVQQEVGGRVQVDQEVADIGQHSVAESGHHLYVVNSVGHVVDESGYLRVTA